MTPRLTRLNPDALHPTPGYHHVTVAEAGRTAHLAGQCPLDHEGNLVGPGSLSTQTDQVVANALTALAAAAPVPTTSSARWSTYAATSGPTSRPPGRGSWTPPWLPPSPVPRPSWASLNWASRGSSWSST
ncbi:Rid family hydrolase [Actinomadura keratinilytica]